MHIQEFEIGETSIEIIDGDRGSNYPKQDEFFEDGYCLFLNAKNVTKDGFKFEENQFISEDKDHVLRKGRAILGDIILTTRGTLGNVAWVSDSVDFEKIRINSGMVLLRMQSDKIIPEFFYMFLRSQFFRKQVEARRSGVAQPQLPIRDLKKIKIPIPDMQKQIEISNTLGTYDKLIENNRRRIALLEKSARLLYREWFVHLRFPKSSHKNPNTPLPDGWLKTRVSKIVRRVSAGRTYPQKLVESEGKVPVLGQGYYGIIGFHNNEPSVYASLDEPVIVFANHTCNQRFMFEPFSGIQNILPFKPKFTDRHNLFWLHHAILGLTKLNAYKGHWPELMAKPLIIPTDELTHVFGEIVKPIHLQIFNLMKQNIKLNKARDILLPRLMDGRIEV